MDIRQFMILLMVIWVYSFPLKPITVYFRVQNMIWWLNGCILFFLSLNMQSVRNITQTGGNPSVFHLLINIGSHISQVPPPGGRNQGRGDCEGEEIGPPET